MVTRRRVRRCWCGTSPFGRGQHGVAWCSASPRGMLAPPVVLPQVTVVVVMVATRTGSRTVVVRRSPMTSTRCACTC